MEELLEKLKKYKSPKKNINIDLNYLFSYIYPDFILFKNDIIIRKENYTEKIKIDMEYIIKTFGSISGFEDFVNHIHVIDIIDCSVRQSLKFGLVIKDILKNKLKTNFPEENFIIVLTCDGKDKNNTIIRFHKYRKNELLYDQKYIDDFCTIKLSIGFLVEKI